MGFDLERGRATAAVAPSPAMSQPELDSIAGAVAALGVEIESKKIQAITDERAASISAALLENPDADIAGMLSAPLELSDRSSKVAREQIAGATQWAASAKLGSMTARGLIAMSSAETSDELETAHAELMSSVQGEIAGLPPEMRQRLGPQIGRALGQVSGEYHKSLEDIARIETQKGLQVLVQSDDDSFQASALIGDWKGILQLPKNFQQDIDSSDNLSDKQKAEAKRKYLLMNQKRIRDNLGMFVKKMVDGREPWGKIIDNMRTFLSAGGAGNRADQDAWIMDNVMPLKRGQEAEDIAALHTEAFASIHTDREATKDDRRELFEKMQDAAKKHADEMKYDPKPFAEMVVDAALKQMNGFEFRNAGDVENDIKNAQIANRTSETLQIIGGEFRDIVETHMKGRSPRTLPPLPSGVSDLPQKNRVEIAEAIGDMNGRLMALFGEDVIVEDDMVASLVKHRVEATMMSDAVKYGSNAIRTGAFGGDWRGGKTFWRITSGGLECRIKLAAISGAQPSDDGGGRFLQLSVDDEYIIRVQSHRADGADARSIDEKRHGGGALCAPARGRKHATDLSPNAVMRFPPAFQSAFNTEFNSGAKPEAVAESSANAIVAAGYRADRNPNSRLEAIAADKAMPENEILDIIAPVKSFIGTARFLPDSGDGLKKALIGDIFNGVMTARESKGETALYVWGRKKNC